MKSLRPYNFALAFFISLSDKIYKNYIRFINIFIKIFVY